MDVIYKLLFVASLAAFVIVVGLIYHLIKEHKNFKPINKKGLEKGVIAVSLETIKADCGAILLHAGSIIKIADPFIDDEDEIRIYRNIQKELDRDFIWVPFKLIRVAKENEVKGYDQGIRNISMLGI